MRTTDQEAADRRRIFLHDGAILLALVVVAGLCLFWWAPWAPDYEVPGDTDIFTVAAGTWDWTTAPADSFCVAKRHTVAFSPDRSWHRTDWPAFGYTAAVRRCPPGTPPVVASDGDGVGS